MSAASKKSFLPLEEKHAAALARHLDQMIRLRRELFTASAIDASACRFVCIEDLVKAKGHVFTQVASRLPRGVAKGTPKYCYANCGRITLGRGGLHYCEGIALGAIPVNHAWLCDDDGVVYEPTWDKPAAAYIGIIFDPVFVASIHEAPDAINVSMIDQWEKGHPLVRGTIDVDSVRINPMENACRR